MTTIRNKKVSDFNSWEELVHFIKDEVQNDKEFCAFMNIYEKKFMEEVKIIWDTLQAKKKEKNIEIGDIVKVSKGMFKNCCGKVFDIKPNKIGIMSEDYIEFYVYPELLELVHKKNEIKTQVKIITNLLENLRTVEVTTTPDIVKVRLMNGIVAQGKTERIAYLQAVIKYCENMIEKITDGKDK